MRRDFFFLLVTKINKNVIMSSFNLDARLKRVAIMANRKYKITNSKKQKEDISW